MKQPRVNKRRRWPWMVAAGAAAVGAVIVLGDEGSSTGTTDEAAALSTVNAEVRDLVEFIELDGRMLYANTLQVNATSDGVVTDVVGDGTMVGQGTVLYEVNGVPVIVFFGEVPLHRPLAEGMAGDDVLMLERALAAMGHHTYQDDDGNLVDTEFVADGRFDSATTHAVERWQQALGLEPSGTVATSDIVVVDGPAIVSSLVVGPGSRVATDATMMDLHVVAAVDAVYLEQGGEIELFVAVGQTLSSGDIVYSVDGVPITAVVADAAFDRDLDDGVDPGADVLAIEQMLVALGYDLRGELVPDDNFDDLTTDAVTQWQEDLSNTFDNVSVDGDISLDNIIEFGPDTVVGSLTGHDTDLLPSGAELWSSWSDTSTRLIETAIAVTDQDRLVVGGDVNVEFLDGEVIAGVVSAVATFSTTNPLDPTSAPMVAIEISIDDIPESASDLSEIEVTVRLIEEIAAGATVVPVGALVAIDDDGFAVETVTTKGTRFVSVDPGMYSDGWVEVVGLAAGTEVVVPS